MERYKVIFDTNLWISLLIGKRLATLEEVCGDSRFAVYLCSELAAEFEDVVSRPKINKYAQSNSIAYVKRLMEDACITAEITITATSDVRDNKDLYLLSLADSIDADFIVSGDKDLLTLQQYNRTQILSFSDFMLLRKAL
ncbi:hypothetical protein FACS1894156_6700 [Bacteroidia bacterium]|nr:hypothetical protein FACS1894156_6700 [Bacteroidia bacterium]